MSDREHNPLAQTASRVVSEAAAALSGSEHAGVRVDGLFHYGAVDFDPQHLVVWILLAGKPDEELPEWMQIVPGRVDPGCQIDYQRLLDLRAHIVQRFLEAGWPRPEDIKVFADSARRVEAAGGHYFKG